MILFISSFEVINIVLPEAKSKGRPDPNIFFWMASSAPDVAAANLNGIKMLLTNCLSTFPFKDNPAYLKFT